MKPRSILVQSDRTVRGAISLAAALSACASPSAGPPGSPQAETGDTGGATCTTQSWYADLDRDGYGSDEALVEACEVPKGYLASGGDCDDLDDTIHPDAPEAKYDGIDQNCNGSADDFGCGTGAAVEVSCDGATVVFGAEGIGFGPLCQAVEVVNRCLGESFGAALTSDNPVFSLGAARIDLESGILRVDVSCVGCQPTGGDSDTMGTLQIVPDGSPALSIPLIGWPNGPNDA